MVVVIGVCVLVGGDWYCVVGVCGVDFCVVDVLGWVVIGVVEYIGVDVCGDVVFFGVCVVVGWGVVVVWVVDLVFVVDW